MTNSKFDPFITRAIKELKALEAGLISQAATRGTSLKNEIEKRRAQFEPEKEATDASGEDHTDVQPVSPAEPAEINQPSGASPVTVANANADASVTSAETPTESKEEATRSAETAASSEESVALPVPIGFVLGELLLLELLERLGRLSIVIRVEGGLLQIVEKLSRLRTSKETAPVDGNQVPSPAPESEVNSSEEQQS